MTGTGYEGMESRKSEGGEVVLSCHRMRMRRSEGMVPDA